MSAFLFVCACVCVDLCFFFFFFFFLCVFILMCLCSVVFLVGVGGVYFLFCWCCCDHYFIFCLKIFFCGWSISSKMFYNECIQKYLPSFSTYLPFKTVHTGLRWIILTLPHCVEMLQLSPVCSVCVHNTSVTYLGPSTLYTCVPLVQLNMASLFGCFMFTHSFQTEDYRTDPLHLVRWQLYSKKILIALN